MFLFLYYYMYYMYNFFAPQQFQKYNVNLNKVRKDGIFCIIYFPLAICKMSSFRAVILSLLVLMETNISINKYQKHEVH